ncbi:MAG: glutamate synthase subunit beta [Actinomycetota bacterium]|nr:glutamate synthase subunit beta [Actinomycetota bacterium]
MGDPRGFLKYDRELPRHRPVAIRVRDWREVYEAFPASSVRRQAARCMDCGIPFCHEGCPLGNLIPEWNDLVYRDQWFEASERLHATNNFPDFTGRLCPAPCEASCVLGINAEPVTIKQIEYEIVERAWAEGWLEPKPPSTSTGWRVAVVGSGPAGLAAAQQLARAGHAVVVFERSPRPGGLLRYGIPAFKLEKRVVDRRLAQLNAEGVELRCGVSVGTGGADTPSWAGGGQKPVDIATLRSNFDVVLLATGATVPRELPIPGRSLHGVHQAMDYLTEANQVAEGSLDRSAIDAAGKTVVIIGGGDTGADCVGTAHRQGARTVYQLEILPEPPAVRNEADPWPTWPRILRTYPAHEEGGERLFSVSTAELVGNRAGNVTGLRAEQVRDVVSPAGHHTFEPVAASTVELRCDLVLLALGFSGPERQGIVADLGLALTDRGSVAVDDQWRTNVDGVFACGDAVKGQSLVVWAIAEGRAAAAAVDRRLMGTSDLPSAVVPGQLPLR